MEIPADVVRKSDLEKIATNQAKEMVDVEVREHWDELIKIPLGGFDTLDAKSIASNLKERMEIFRSRNPKDAKKEDTSHLRETTAPKGTGGDAPKDNDSKIQTPIKPEGWYPKKES